MFLFEFDEQELKYPFMSNLKWSTVVHVYVCVTVLSEFKLGLLHGIKAIYLPNLANWGHCEENWGKFLSPSTQK